MGGSVPTQEKKNNLQPYETHSALSHTETTASPNYPATDCPRHTLRPQVTPDPLKLNLFGNFVNSNAIHTALTLS